MCHKLHAYRSLHECLLPPDIQNLPPQSTSCCSIKSSEHNFDTSGNDGEGNTADIHAVTGHQTGNSVSPNCACGSLCMCSCLLDGPVDTEDY